MGKFILQVPRNTQNVSAMVGADFVPLHIHQMDRVYGLTNRLLASTSDLVQEALQVAEGQGGDRDTKQVADTPDRWQQKNIWQKGVTPKR